MRIWKSLTSKHAPQNRQDEFSEELPVGEGVRQLSRRDFFRWSGLGFAASLAVGCDTKKAQKALAYVQGEEGVVPGVDRWYASACAGCTAGCGVLAKVRDGRPIKLEGNPDHPLSKGGLCAVAHGMLRDLYDSERLSGPRVNGAQILWADLDRDLLGRFRQIREQGGAVRVLCTTLASPTLRAAAERFAASFKDGKIVIYDPLSAWAIREAHRLTHGASLLPHYKVEQADLLVTIEADLLGTWIDPAGFGRAYGARRDVTHPRGMNRHVAFEAGMSLTGSNADQRVRVAPSELTAVLEHLAAVLAGGSPSRNLDKDVAAKVHALAEDLEKHKGRSLVVCGLNDLSAQIYVNRINHALGNEGATLDLASPGLQKQGDDAALTALRDELKAGKVQAIVILEANPVYDLSGFEFASALAKVPLRLNLGRLEDETATACTHLAPDHHPFETWRDAEAVAGVWTLAQPLLNPLFGTRDALESLALWAGTPKTAMTQVQETWRERVFPKAGGIGFDAFWNDALQKGVVDLPTIASALWFLKGESPLRCVAVPPTIASAPAWREDRTTTEAALGHPRPSKGEHELLLYTKAGVREGRHSHNPWNQELPDPITKVTWDNYAMLSPASAGHLGMAQGDLLRLRQGGRDLVLPVVVQPGLHDRTVAVALGYGRAKAGKHGTGVGQDAMPFLGSGRTAAAGSVELSPVPGRMELACTQDHHLLEGRDLVREMGKDAYLKDPASARHEIHGGTASLYPDKPKGAHHWVMVIDLSKCSGCSACVLSCQAENNLPVVGKDEVRRKREMHWMRIDRYYTGGEADPGVVHQPMLCQQCDNAPCENVCPVVATVHNEEGFNQQVYNRCVGTRYCANNCPYKTRRFNWFNYDRSDAVENLALNPDVTVRSRGIMEKCTFCVQRIQLAKAEAKNEGRPLKDGEMKTACQQSCPGMAILFGDAQDPDSEVAKALQDPRRYAVLGELGVLPNVTYFTRLKHAALENHGGHHGA